MVNKSNDLGDDGVCCEMLKEEKNFIYYSVYVIFKKWDEREYVS